MEVYPRRQCTASEAALLAGRILFKLQKIVGFSRLRHEKEYYRKGYANWSITDALARYILENSVEIMRECRHAFLADEVCFHTLVYHSRFYANVYDPEDEYHSVMRITTWENEQNQLHFEDVPMLLKSGRLFARKFDDERATETIAEIIRLREKTAEQGPD